MPLACQVAVGLRDKLTVHGSKYPTPDGPGLGASVLEVVNAFERGGSLRIAAAFGPRPAAGGRGGWLGRPAAGVPDAGSMRCAPTAGVATARPARISIGLGATLGRSSSTRRARFPCDSSTCLIRGGSVLSTA